MNGFSYRYADKNDAEKILFFIKKLAEYEKMANEVIATKELIEELPYSPFFFNTCSVESAQTHS